MSLQMAEVQAKMEEVEKAGTDGRNEVTFLWTLFLIGFPYAVPPWKSYTPTFNALFFIFGPDIILQFGDRLVALENKIDETLTESISVLKQVTFLP